jgi:hypothetical protein
MKKYPRIHSLSTLGLIHHQDNDYLFHPTRTDFMGDSASGKSIIADLLQLIFVGSSAFKSSTITLGEKRDPNGLVLSLSENGAEFGYALLNIEIEQERYVTIGMYLESNNKSTKPFIIQASTEIENDKLTSMYIPLKTTDFKIDDKVYDIEELSVVMDEKSLIFKKFDRINSYHHILFVNGILPLDLAANDKMLNDYAQIIQSFSRGKSLNTNNSTSLLNFLFGQEKSKELYNTYSGIIKELENTVYTYGQNLNEINKLTKKSKRICELKKKLDNMRGKEKSYFSEELLFFQIEYDKLSALISQNTKEYLSAVNNLKQLVNAAEKDVNLAQNVQTDIEKNVDKIFGAYTLANQQHNTLIHAEELLSQLKIEKESLESIYQDYCKTKEQYFIFQDFKAKLLNEKLEFCFENSEWMKGINIGNEYYSKRINELEIRLTQLELVSQYFDINNPESLVRWAISLNRPLNRIEESLIMHFQDLKRIKPDNPQPKERYLPIPEKLFANTKIEEVADGFWFDLDGIYEYVKYIHKPRLDTTDQNIIHGYFKSQVKNIADEKKHLNEEFANLKKLNDIFSHLENPSKAIEAYKNKNQLKDFVSIESFDNHPENIKSYISILPDKEKISQEFELTKKEYNDALARQAYNNTLLKNLPQRIGQARNILNKVTADDPLVNSIIQLFSICPVANDNLNFYLDAEDKVDTFQTELNLLKDNIELIKSVKENRDRLDEISIQIAQKKEKYLNLYQNLSLEVHNDITSQSVDKKYTEYTNAKYEYNVEFNFIVDEFIPNEKYRFEASNDFPELIYYLLPDIFGYDRVIEEEAIDRIDKHLHDIYEKGKKLNDRKIQKIENLLGDVYGAVSKQVDVVRRINRFFNDGKKKISGNYHLNLIHNESKEFPVSWLIDFKTQASRQLNLFELNSIAEKLSLSVSIEEKILEAFREITGFRNRDIKIGDLLNPNSYMNLNLEMHNDKGRTNKGSTGQTYAAIALLCIARLSIVGNKKQAQESGIRFMPIDEAEGLGSNFDMLHDIAQKYDYQIITFSINPLGRYDEQYIYILHRNLDADIDINYTPMAIHSQSDIKNDFVEI